MAFTLFTFVFFTALVAVISWWMTRKDNLDTAEGYFLAGRSLPGVVIAGSLLLTNLSAEQLVGFSGQAWQANMGPIAWEVGSTLGLLIMAYYFLPRYLKMGVTTIPQLLEDRFDRATKGVFAIGFLVVYICVNLPVILYSGSLVFENIFGISGLLHITKFQSIVAICIVTGIIGACYAIFGGLKAVAVSDTINGVGLILGGLMIPFLGLIALGKMFGEGDGSLLVQGWNYMVTADPSKMNAINAANAPAPEVPWPLLFSGILVTNVYAWCTHQSFVQRALAAKNLKEAQKGVVLAGFLKLMGPFYLIMPGIIAYYLLGDKVTMMDEAYPMLITRVVPAPVMGFFAAVMFGAILSSFNSVLNSSVTMYILDIHKGFFKPNATDHELVKTGKVVGTILAVVSVSMAPMVYFASGGIATFLNSLLHFIATPVLVCVLAGFMFDKLPKFSARFIFAFHIIAYGIFMTSGSTIHFLYAVAVLFTLEMVMMWGMHKYIPDREKFIMKNIHAVELSQWQARHAFSIIAIIAFIAIYVMFSPLGLAA